MTDPSESTPPSENLTIVSEPSCWMGTSSVAEYATALASEGEPGIPSSSTTFFSTCSEPMSCEGRKAGSGDDTSVEDAIERSKVHWSELIEQSESDEEEAEVSNVKVFRSLQTHPTWGSFFLTFGDGGMYDLGELEVGEKFAEGGQAELYHAHVSWKYPEDTSQDEERGLKYVLKVFRKGTFLRDLQKQWPEGMFRNYEEIVRCFKCGESQETRYTCDVSSGTLLADGRFAFLLGNFLLKVIVSMTMTLFLEGGGLKCLTMLKTGLMISYVGVGNQILQLDQHLERYWIYFEKLHEAFGRH